MKKALSFLLTIMLFVSCLNCIVVPAQAAVFPFFDVSTYHQYYDSIKYVYDNGYMVGVTSVAFKPNETITRAMLVTILYRMSGSTLQRAPTGFTDVDPSSYYYHAVGWAQYYNITQGTSQTAFSPNVAVRHQDFLTILYRYLTNYLGYSYSLVNTNLYQNLTDYTSISSYARTAVNWAMNCDVVTSTSTVFGPNNDVSRGLCAKYIHYAITMGTGNSRGFADRELTESTAEEIVALLNRKGYAGHLNYDLTPTAMEFAFRNSSIVYSHSHGGNNCIQLGTQYLYSNQIDHNSLENASLLYISACKAGGVFCETLFETGGADAVIGFTTNVAASTAKDGIHYFNERFFYYYLNHYEIEDAIDFALSDTETNYDKTYGAESIMLYK